MYKVLFLNHPLQNILFSDLSCCLFLNARIKQYKILNPSIIYKLNTDPHFMRDLNTYSNVSRFGVKTNQNPRYYNVQGIFAPVNPTLYSTGKV